MGNRTSLQRRIEKAKSDAIDRQLKEDFARKRDILLLGPAGSGKSTIVKWFKIICQGGFTDDELTAYRLTIYRNTLDSAQVIVFAMRKMGLGFVDTNNRLNAERVSNYQIDRSPAFVFSSEIAEAIDQLWRDPIMPKLMDRGSKLDLMDNAIYFFTNVRRIGSPTYQPTEEDVIRAYRPSVHITETMFTIDQHQIHLFDFGVHCSNRRKWIHFLGDITSIIFCAALSEYDQVLPEDENQNRMDGTLTLFESIINSRWFSRTSIILFLTKSDVFKAKLPKVPLERYFPEYSGGADVNEAAKYLFWRFMQKNRARLSVYPHITQATDTTSMRLVLAAVKEASLQNAIKGPSIL